MKSVVVVLALLAIATANPLVKSIKDVFEKKQTDICTSTCAAAPSNTFCTDVNYQTCPVGLSAGSADASAQSAYNTGLQILGDVKDVCKNSYKTYVCSLYFPQCSGTTAFRICTSTCENYFKVCGAKDAAEASCSNGLLGTTTEKTVGPADNCTGAGSMIAPSMMLVVVLALFAKFF